MPKAYDAHHLTVTNDPTERLDLALPKLPDPLDLAAQIINGIIEALKDLTGIDLSGPEAFVISLIDVITTGGPIGQFATMILDMISEAIGIGPISVILPELLGGFLGIDLSAPGAILAAIAHALEGIIGDITHAITGIFGGGLPDLSSWSGGLSGAVSGAVDGVADLIHKLLTAPATVLGDIPKTLVDGLDSALGDLASTAQGIVDGIVNSLNDAVGSFWGQNDANDALAAQAAATAQAAAALAAIQASQNQNNTGGINALVDFSTFPDSADLPSVFTETYDASGLRYGVVSGVGRTTTVSPGGARTYIGEYNVVDTLTDYQRVGAVWPGSPGISYQNPTPFFAPTPYFGMYRADTHLYCRYKDILNWVRVRFVPGDSHGTVAVAVLENCVTGTITELDRVSHKFLPNTAYFLEAGFGLALRTFRVIAGTSVIMTTTDPGTLTQAGPAFRGAAIGGTGKGAVALGGPVNPSPILYFSLQDNSPASVIGSGARVFRAATGGVTQAAAAEITNGFFDTVEFLTSEYAYAFVNRCRITVSKTDWYIVAARLGGTSTAVNLFINGIIVRQSTLPNTTAVAGDICSVMYLHAGDAVSVGAVTGGSYSGNAGGTASYLEITRVGRVNS